MEPARPSVKSVFRTLMRAARDSRGATAIEYGLIVSLIVIGLATAVAALGGNVSGTWNNIYTKFLAATPH